MRFKAFMSAMVAVLGLFALHAVAQTVWVGRFQAPADQLPEPWRLVTINKLKPTAYRVLSWDGVQAIEARAEASMALLAREVQVDLSQTPVLCWRWRVENLVNQADMLKKSGDDYPARVYVAFSLPPSNMSFAVRAKLKIARSLYGDLVPDGALNYVWDNKSPVGTMHPNVYTDRTHMKVQRSGAAQLGTWVNERVNVLDDAPRVFGLNAETPGLRLSLLAVASDTDNTAESARAGFADLHFVPATAACEFTPLKP